MTEHPEITDRVAVIERVLIDLLAENYLSFFGGAEAAMNAIHRLNCRKCQQPEQCRLSGCCDKVERKSGTAHPSPSTEGGT